MHSSNCSSLIAVLTAVVFTATCTSTKEVRGVDLRQEFGHDVREVVGFTSVDGGRHDFQGSGQVSGEELLLHRREGPGEPTDHSSSSDNPDAPASEYHLPLEQVSTVDVRYTDGWKSVGLGAAIVLGVLLVVVIVAGASSKPSYYPYSSAPPPTRGPPSMENTGVALSFDRHPAMAGGGAAAWEPGLAPRRER
jgi:hypothetical protein